MTRGYDSALVVLAPPGGPSCPDEDQLLAFVEGRLSGDARDSLLAHIADCDHCLSAIGALGETARPDDQAGGPPTTFQPGDRVAARYQIKRFIARGGMGEVYEAGDELLAVRVALKTVLPSNGASPRAIELIRREVQVARAINHPGVCRVFDLGEHVDGGARRFFLTMEFLDGVTLGQQIRAHGAMPPERLLAISRQLCDGLAAAHEAGVVHRDFKSDNVMLLAGSQGGTPRAVIMDFGLARGGPMGVGLSSTGGLMVGSAAYMAPEQVQGGPVRQAADIYAFGVVLYEAATGSLPFVGTTAIATATKRLMEKPQPPRERRPDLDPRIEDIILRCLSFLPEARFPTMADVRAALGAMEWPVLEVVPAGAPAAGGDDAARPAVAVPSPVPTAIRRRRVGWLAAAAGVCAIAALALMAANRQPRAVIFPTTPVKDVGGRSPSSPNPSMTATEQPSPQREIVTPGETAPAASSSVVAVRPKEGNRQNKPATSPRPARDGTRTTAAAHTQSSAAPMPGPASPDAGQRSRSTLDGFANPFER